MQKNVKILGEKKERENNMNMYGKIKEGMTLGKVKSIAWYVVGEDYFKPISTKVRIEDVNGKVFELVIHTNPSFRKLRNEEEVILNVVLSTHGVMPEGEWIGISNDIHAVIDICRKNFPYTGVFHINKDSFGYKTGWEDPEFVF